MKTIRLLCLFLVLTLLISAMSSCSARQYSDVYSCEDIVFELKRDTLDQEYTEYSPDDVKYMIKNASLFNSHSIIYSSSSDDIGEIGILRANNKENREALYQAASEYISELKAEKRAFVENYLPDQLEKLDFAEVRRFGNYIVFTVLGPDERDKVFKKIEDILSS